MKLLSDLIDLIFPNSCMICEDKINHKNHFICIHCKNHLPFTNHFNLIDNELSRKLSPLFEFERAASLLYFESSSAPQKLIHQFKYHSKKELAFELGYLIGSHLNNSDWVEDVDYLIPVPLHKKKQKLRGYNQSLYLAKGISDSTGIPILQKALFRKKNKESQTKKSRVERMSSIAQNFEWDTNELKNIGSFALIDDMITTGATASACINSLPNEKRPDVYFISLAMDK